jgi:hypothetical protein
MCHPLTVHFRVRIGNRYDDTRDTSLHECISTCRRSTLVGARFKSDIDSCARSAMPGFFQGDDLGMVFSSRLVPARSDNFAFISNDTANPGIGMCRVQPLFCQTQGQGHTLVIKAGKIHSQDSGI